MLSLFTLSIFNLALVVWNCNLSEFRIAGGMITVGVVLINKTNQCNNDNPCSFIQGWIHNEAKHQGVFSHLSVNTLLLSSTAMVSLQTNTENKVVKTTLYRENSTFLGILKSKQLHFQNTSGVTIMIKSFGLRPQTLTFHHSKWWKVQVFKCYPHYWSD